MLPQIPGSHGMHAGHGKSGSAPFTRNSFGVGGFSGAPCNHDTRRDRDSDRDPCPRNIPRRAHDDKRSRSSRTASVPKKEWSGKPARFFSFFRSFCSVLSCEAWDPVPPPLTKRGRGCVYSISIPGNSRPDRRRDCESTGNRRKIRLKSEGMARSWNGKRIRDGFSSSPVPSRIVFPPSVSPTGGASGSRERSRSMRARSPH